MVAPTLNIIIPFYNSEKTLGVTLRTIGISLSNIDTPENISFIFVDNNSDDLSKEIVNDWSNGITANVLITDEPRQGVSYARNRGLGLSNANFIGFIDADDEVHPDYFSEILATLKADVDLIILKIFYPSDSKMANVSSGNKPLDCEGHECLKYIKGWWNFGFVSRRELIAKYQFIGNCFEDFGLFPLIISESKTVRVINKPLYQYNLNSDSITARSDIKKLDQISLQYKRLTESLDKNSYILSRVRADYLELLTSHRAINGIYPLHSFDELLLITNCHFKDMLSMLYKLTYRFLSVLKRRSLSL